MDPKYVASSSAKIIGDRLFCLIDGVSVLQPQKISKKRRLQLKRALLLATPTERLEYGFHEVYLHNGIRITIFSGKRTKENQDIMIFRKYIIKNYSFESIAKLGTIPYESIEFFKDMIKIGFNVMFAGQVRSGKTTFMQVWQSYEDTSLEGLAIATDPETPWHEIMPNAPIMQLTADGKDLENITKSLLRGDNDYVLLEEMRDALAYNIALEITSTGTTRSKATIHDNDAINIPFKMASKIKERYGGDMRTLIAQVFKNFDYIFEFTQDPVRRDKKIMKGITELSYSPLTDKVIARQICKYNFQRNEWLWNSSISNEKKEKAILNRNTLLSMEEKLRELSLNNPLENELIEPAYYKKEVH